MVNKYMKTAVRNIKDLIIEPQKCFARMVSYKQFNLNQYILYVISVLLIAPHKNVGGALQAICILASTFLTGWLYMCVISACGGKLDYWRSFNGQVCMGTLANLGELFEIGHIIKFGGAISLAINIYCIYLHICYVINVGGANVRRTSIVYIAIFIMVTLIVYFSLGFLLLAGSIINERGYIS